MKKRLYLRRALWIAALLPLCAAVIDAAPWSGGDWLGGVAGAETAAGGQDRPA